MTNIASLSHAILIFSALFAATMTEYTPPIRITCALLIVFLSMSRLTDIVTWRLTIRKAKRKVIAIGGILLKTAVLVLFMLFPTLIVVSLNQLTDTSILLPVISSLWLSFAFFVLLNPVRLLLDTIRFRKAMKELKICGGTLPRPRLEQMLDDIRGKRVRARLITQLSRMNIQLTGDWAGISRPVIGIEGADQMLTSLDIRDLSVAR